MAPHAARVRVGKITEEREGVVPQSGDSLFPSIPALDQAEKLAEILQCDPESIKRVIGGLPPLPETATGWGVFADISALGGIAYSYCDALRKVFEKIEETARGCNQTFHCDAPTPINLRRGTDSIRVCSSFESEQPYSGLFVAPVCIGAHRITRQREMCFELSTLSVGCMILSHLHFRQCVEGDFIIDCIGDEVEGKKGEGVPFFKIGNGEIRFGIRPAKTPRPLNARRAFGMYPIPTTPT